MIICSCHVVSDADIEDVLSASEPPRTMSQVYHHLGHDPSCGRCVRSVRKIMRDAGQPCQRKGA